MFCLDCRYDLKDSTRTQCVECGRTFDPDDDSTFRRKATGPHVRPGNLSRLDWTAISCFSIPYLMLAFMPLTWLMVWFELGRQPTYSNPDPKQVTGLMSRACLFAFETLAWLTLPSLVLCVVVLLVQMVRAFTRYERVKPFVITLFTCIMLFIGSYVLLSLSVQFTKASEWILD